MALPWKSKIILAKLEASYGVDPTLAAGNGMLMTNVNIRPMQGQDVSRDLELPFMGGQEQIPVGLHVELSGRIELVPSGTPGVAPAWGPIMRMLGCSETIVADTSVTYRPVSSNHESGYLKFWIGGAGTGTGTLHQLAGVRGDAVLRFPAQGIPYLDNIRLVGLYAGVSEAARVPPTLTGFKRPRVVTKANTPSFTIDGDPFVMRSFALAMRNQVEPRLLVGLEEILIVDRADQITTQVQAVPVSTYDPYAAALADEDATLVPIELVHGTQAGFIATLNAPTCQQQRPDGYQQSQGIAEWNLTYNALPAGAGNNQWSLALT